MAEIQFQNHVLTTINGYLLHFLLSGAIQSYLSMKLFNAEAILGWSNIPPAPLTYVLPLGNLFKPHADMWSLIPGKCLCLWLQVLLWSSFLPGNSRNRKPSAWDSRICGLLWEPLKPSGKHISFKNVILKIPMGYEYILDLRIANHECKKLSNSK